MLSSITKKGEIESTFAPLVVLVINNNIHVIGLMVPLSLFQEKLNDRDGKRIVEIPQDARKCKEMNWQSFKQEDSTFYFVRNHFESIGKPILLKGGEVMLVNKLLHVHKC